MRDTSAYKINGQRVPSVTEVLQLADVSIYGGVPPDVLETARIRGHRVHEWTEWYDSDRSTDPPDRAGIEGYCAAYRAFMLDTRFKVLSAEGVVLNKTYLYAGRYDRVGVFSVAASRTVLDIKCVAALSVITKLQLSGYRMALKKVEHRAALQLKPDGTYRLEHYTSPEDDHDFLSCVRVAHFKLRHGLATLED